MPKRTFIHNICTIMLISAIIGVSIGIIDTFLLIYSNLFLDEQCFPWIILKDTCQAVTKSDYGNIWGNAFSFARIYRIRCPTQTIAVQHLRHKIALTCGFRLFFSANFFYLFYLFTGFRYKKMVPLVCNIVYFYHYYLFFFYCQTIFKKR